MNQRKTFTIDDIPTAKLKKAWNENKQESNNLLKLLQIMKIQIEVLEQCNRIICQETTKFILKNKPIFDGEKLKLYKLESVKQRLIEIGLFKIYIIEHINFDSKLYLNENTFSEEWNNNAKEINKLFTMCIENNNRYHDATVIYYNKDKKIILKRNKICAYTVCIIFMLIIFIGLIYYKFIMQ